jgi:phage/conjugal plasmid C-4 type zinc finger TraR family protein
MNAADEAQAIEEADRAAGLKLVQAQMKAGKILPTASNCGECGNMIPSERQAANPGCQLCTGCAEEFERRARRARGAVAYAA